MAHVISCHKEDEQTMVIMIFHNQSKARLVAATGDLQISCGNWLNIDSQCPSP
jgi:hypothetical protein